MIVTLTPNPSIDRTYELDGLAPGRLHRATRVHTEPSGKGVNVARALAANAVPATAVFPSGGPEGTRLCALLAAEGVRFVAVPVEGLVRVNISLTEPGGRTTKINESGPALSAAEAGRLVAATLDAGRPGGWVVASGSLPPGLDDAFYAALGARVGAAGARFALDTSGAPLTAGLAAGPDVVKPNVDELAEATGRPVATLSDAVEAARVLIGRGARGVLVSAGPDGALLVTGGDAVHARCDVADPRSTIGAGDALLAGFVAGGGTGDAALREGVAWATAAIRTEGSRVPRVTDADRAAVRLTRAIDLARTLRGS